MSIINEQQQTVLRALRENDLELDSYFLLALKHGNPAEVERARQLLTEMLGTVDTAFAELWEVDQ